MAKVVQNGNVAQMVAVPTFTEYELISNPKVHISFKEYKKLDDEEKKLYRKINVPKAVRFTMNTEDHSFVSYGTQIPIYNADDVEIDDNGNATIVTGATALEDYHFEF